jgi:hypothetical protein
MRAQTLTWAHNARSGSVSQYAAVLSIWMHVIHLWDIWIETILFEFIWIYINIHVSLCEFGWMYVN